MSARVARRLGGLAAALAACGVLAACSTGVEEADRAIFVTACQNVAQADNATCGCAYDFLRERNGDTALNETIDDLQGGRTPEELLRAIASCQGQVGGGGDGG